MVADIISTEMKEIIKTVVRAELKVFIKEFAEWANKQRKKWL